MSALTTLRDPIVGKWRRYRIGIVAFGMLVFGVSAVGIWFSLPPASAPIPDARSVVAVQRNFAFTPYKSPRLVADVEFQDGNGRRRTLASFRGKVILLNIWATWCGPCRKEMPTLDRLRSTLGSKDFEVVALSIDRGGQAAVKSFYDEIDIRALGVYVDATTDAQAKLAIIGVPTTLLIDQKGREVARYTGPAEWDRPEVIEIIRRYLAPGNS